VGGFVAYASVISILIILLAVCALIVVNALKQSPWGVHHCNDDSHRFANGRLSAPVATRACPGDIRAGFVLVLTAIWADSGRRRLPLSPSTSR